MAFWLQQKINNLKQSEFSSNVWNPYPTSMVVIMNCLGFIENIF
jgi:hypothetical protein